MTPQRPDSFSGDRDGGAANGGPILGIGRLQWADAWAGLKAIAPLMPGSAAFGLAFGALVPVAGINPWTGLYASVSVVAGASQFSVVESVRANAPAVIAVLTALIINARFALYSAALGPVFSAFPRRWKLGLAHIMTDQAAVVALHHADRFPDPVRRRWFVVGGALPFVLVWIVGTLVGVLAGPVIPESWQIGFIVPLMFIAVMVPTLRRSEDVVALAVTGVVVLVTRGLPYGLNVMVGIVVGIVAGTAWAEWADARRRRRGDSPESVAEAAEHEAEGGL
ncbi:AzlC family ABC transporter permease [Demequina sp. TTPB684]|uniref:AzlC family ABC transporter permease n=1 Tax=unclassified Demequina TaxID=2620311 RepID=UPI001CF0FEFB|nr:AzlC family ABC transporter permease [Demequina sp. TMPB413]MCB2411401.1 AzlC family ABC transporter permease [Demequina sp. TTPB684]UPU87562.1 AzlC family ABC transporter permease [Demequina sp. TMPB413]